MFLRFRAFTGPTITADVEIYFTKSRKPKCVFNSVDVIIQFKVKLIFRIYNRVFGCRELLLGEF